MMAGVEMVHLPYRGTGPMLTDLIDGQVQVAFDPLPAEADIPHTSRQWRCDAIDPHPRNVENTLPNSDMSASLLPRCTAVICYT
jgi:tripartite-type tricarboxylate transporter receptor subunit TctC